MNNPNCLFTSLLAQFFLSYSWLACFYHSRSDEDAIREIMADAIRSAKQRIAKAASYTEHIDPFLFSIINKPSKDPTSGKERADDTVDNANNDYGRKAKVENKSPLPARLAATAPALNDGSSGCDEKGDMPPHGSGTSGYLTAPDVLENDPEQGRVTNQRKYKIFVEKCILHSEPKGEHYILLTS